MKYNQLGNTGLFVSEICLGTMTFGEATQGNQWGSIADVDQDMADRIVERSLAAGVNFIDTADVYSGGMSEVLLGQALQNLEVPRKDVVIATKVYGVVGDKPNDRGASRGHIMDSVEESLERLQTDHIDLYQIHWPNRSHYHFRNSWTFDASTQDREQSIADIIEKLQTLDDLVKAGKIRAVGLSNETAWGTMQYLRLAEEKALPRVASIQNEYNLLYRTFDLDLAEVAHHGDVGLLAYSPLAAGLLTGKYLNGARPAGSRGTINTDLGGRLQPKQEPAVKSYIEVAGKHGLDAAQMALAFCLERPFMASVIIGATSMDQLKKDIGSADITLSEDVMSDIAEVHRHYPMPI
jgi:aryl-alcohol dehydrogenase-like predicted oxidoreductase